MRLTGSMAALLLLLVTACNGGADEPDGEGTEGGETEGGAEGEDDLGLDIGEEPAPTVQHGEQSAIETIGITPPETPWESMSTADRELYMIGKILPITHELFVRYDAEQYDHDFGCESCHGDDMRERSFEMPNPRRMVIHPPGTPQREELNRQFPEMERFMREDLVPAMQTMMGNERLGCWSCHPRPPR